MKVITAIFLILFPTNYAKPLSRVSLMQSVMLPKNHDYYPTTYYDNNIYDLDYPLMKSIDDERNNNKVMTYTYSFDDFLNSLPLELSQKYLNRLKQSDQFFLLQDLENIDENNSEKTNYIRKNPFLNKKNKRYVNNSIKHYIEKNGRPYYEEIRNLTLCHFKICNMGKRTTQY